PAELAGVEQMVGLFINTVPIRVQLRPDDSLETLLAAVQDSQARMLPYQYVGLSDIQQAAGGGSLFDTLVGFENYPLDRAAVRGSSPELRVVGVVGRDTRHYPLTLVVPPGEQLHLRLDYGPSRFSQSSVEALSSFLERLFSAAVARPNAALYQLDLLSADEPHTPLSRANATTRGIPQTTLTPP